MAADVGRDVRRAQFALHQLDGGENGALRAAGAEGRRARRQRSKRRGGLRLVRDQRPRFGRQAVAVEALRLGGLQEGGQALQQHVGRIFAGLRQRAFAVDLGLDIGAAQFDIDRVLDIGRVAFLHHQHGALCGAELADLLRHQRIDDVEHQERNARGAEHVRQADALQRAQHAVGEPTHDDNADIRHVAGEGLVELVLADEFARGRQALFDLQLLLREDHRRMRQPAVFEARRAGELVEAGDRALAVILGGEFAGGVAGADAQLQHDRRVACLRQLEALLHGAHDRRQVGTRVEQPHRGFQRIGIGALLDDAGALAVILAQDDHGAADDAGRGQVGERVGRHIGADDRFPGHRAA